MRPHLARAAGYRDETPAEAERSRAVADAVYRERRKRAAEWATAHPEELERIERLVDRDLGARPNALTGIHDEIRRGRILAEILKRCDVAPQPALAQVAS